MIAEQDSNSSRGRMVPFGCDLGGRQQFHRGCSLGQIRSCSRVSDIARGIGILHIHGKLDTSSTTTRIGNGRMASTRESGR